MDDDIEQRPEYRRLLKLVGYDDDKALGMLVRFWRLAQKYWGEHQLVPLEDIENWEFQPIVDSRWGVVREDGVYAIGSEERFAWYRQKCDAAKKGGRPKDESGHKPDETEDKLEQTETKPEKTEANRNKPIGLPRIDSANPLVPVPVLSPENNKKKSLKAADAPNLQIGRFIATYVKAFQKIYPPEPGKDPPRPDLRGKVQGEIKRYLEDVPIDRACEMIQVYCQMDDSWFKTKCYDFTTFVENQNKVSVALNTGRHPGAPIRRGIEEILAEDGS